MYRYLSKRCVADIISTVEFDHTGNYLATGDKGGRVVLFERNQTVSEGLHSRSIIETFLITLHPWTSLIPYRRKPANTNFILSSNHTNQNSIT